MEHFCSLSAGKHSWWVHRQRISQPTTIYSLIQWLELCRFVSAFNKIDCSFSNNDNWTTTQAHLECTFYYCFQRCAFQRDYFEGLWAVWSEILHQLYSTAKWKLLHRHPEIRRVRSFLLKRFTAHNALSFSLGKWMNSTCLAGVSLM